MQSRTIRRAVRLSVNVTSAIAAHAWGMSGLAAGFGVAPYVGASTAAGVLLCGMATSAAALLPDLDHVGSTATRRFGALTKGVSHVLRALSAAVYAVTKGPRDEDCTGKHRHLTHTAVWAALLGALVGFGTLWAAEYHPYAGAGVVIGVLACLTILAEAQFGHWVLLAPATTAVSVLAQPDPIAALTDLAGVLGWAVAIGCLVHDLGDALTMHGCPFLWPLPYKGETWYEFRPPRFLRFRAGGPVERVLTWFVFAPLAAWFAVLAGVPDLPTQLAAVL